MHFFTHARRDPDGDSNILSVFAGIGVQPLADYVCDRGRTRVLLFPVPSDGDSIAALCRRLLTEVYGVWSMFDRASSVLQNALDSSSKMPSVTTRRNACALTCTLAATALGP